MFDRSVVARAKIDADEMIDAARADRLALDASVAGTLTHQIGHLALALGERLIEVGKRLDRHDDCGECPAVSKPGLAHP